MGTSFYGMPHWTGEPAFRPSSLDSEAAKLRLWWSAISGAGAAVPRCDGRHRTETLASLDRFRTDSVLRDQSSASNLSHLFPERTDIQADAAWGSRAYGNLTCSA